MKKLFALLILAVGLSTSVFALSLSVGGNINAGGTLSTDSQYQGMTFGGGAFANVNLLAGLGLQAELNVSTSKMLVNQNSIYFFDDYTIYDFPIMAWLNVQLGKLVIGGGAGINLSTIENIDYYPVDKFSFGFAAGANVIFLLGRHFGVVLGAHGVFDFTPHISVTQYNGGSSYTFYTSNWTRQSIYGNLGLEFRF